MRLLQGAHGCGKAGLRARAHARQHSGSLGRMWRRMCTRKAHVLTPPPPRHSRCCWYLPDQFMVRILFVTSGQPNLQTSHIQPQPVA